MKKSDFMKLSLEGKKEFIKLYILAKQKHTYKILLRYLINDLGADSENFAKIIGAINDD